MSWCSDYYHFDDYRWIRTYTPINGNKALTVLRVGPMSQLTEILIAIQYQLSYLQRYFYRLLVTDAANGCADPISNTTPVTVQDEPVLNVTANNPIVCLNGSSVITTSITGGSGSFVYQWQISPDGTSNWSNVASGGSGSAYTVPTSIAGTYYYRIILTDTANGCNDPAPVVVMIEVESQPSVAITANNTNLCIGGSSTLTSVVSNGSGFFTYQWQSSPNGSSWTNITVQGNGVSYAVPSAVPNSAYYRVLVTDVSNGCTDPVSNAILVEVEGQPSVAISIDNQEICVGGSALITSTVSNGSNNIIYQWQSSATGNNPWINITLNGNGANYTPLTNLAGTSYYRVLVTDAGNGCTDPISDPVQLIVQPQPTVSIAVDNPQVCLGGFSTVSSTVNNGSGFFDFQWQISPNGVSGWSSIGTNGTFPTYEVPTSVAGTFYYRVLVDDLASGCSDPVSNVISVVINPDLVVTTQPSNVEECIGGTATMSVIISGGSGTISYQWQYSGDGSDPWDNATGVGSTTATYTPPSTVAGSTYYRVLINGASSGCGQVISAIAYAIIYPDLLVTVQPTPVTECIGGTSTMTVAVTGGTGSVSYQWEASTNGTNWSNATGTGATTTTYTPSSTAAGTTYYRVSISTPGSGCGTVISNVVTAIISQDIAVTTQPANISECIGGALTMNVAISGGSGATTYQWQSSPDGTNGWANATGTGSTTNTYTPQSTVSGTTYYRVLINAANSGCGQAVSNTATAVINQDISVTTQPSNLNECVGGTGQLTVAITGGTGTFSYQWQTSPFGAGTWANASGTGSTTATYTPPSATPGTLDYRVLINATGNGCGQAVSQIATVTIDPDATVSVAPASSEVCIGGSVLLTSTLTGGSDIAGVQWQINSAGWNDIPGQTSLTYSPSTTAAGTTQYRVRVVDGGNGCSQPFSNIVSVIVQNSPTVTISVNNPIVCLTGSALISSSITNGSSNIAYQWQSSPNGTDPWTNIAVNGASATYAPLTNAVGTTYYRVRITDAASGCTDPVSASVLFTVQPQPTVTIALNNPVVCVTGSALITSTVLNGTPNISYQWQSSPNGSNPWTNITVNGTGATYSPLTNLAGTTYYRVVVTDAGSGCNDPVSASVQLIVQPQPTVTIAADNPQICVGGVSTISSTVNNGSALFTYQWQTSPNGTSGWANVSANGTNPTYSVPTSTAGTFYFRVIVTDSASGCNDPVSNVSTIVIAPDLTVTTQPTSIIECIGGTDAMTVVVSGGSGTISYQWQSSATGADPWGPATGTGATTSTFTPPSTVAGTTYYRVLINASNSGCGQAVSGTATALIQPDLSITTQPTPVTECIGGTSTMSVTVTGGTGSLGYQWETSTNGTNWSNASGPGSTTSVYTPPSTAAGTTFYRVTITTPGSGCGAATSNVVTAIISQDITVTTQPSNITECVGGTLTMTLAISGGSGAISYQWQSSPDGTGSWANATGTGATTSTYTPVSTVAGTTYYRVLINAANSGCDQAVSNTATAIIIARYQYYDTTNQSQ